MAIDIVEFSPHPNYPLIGSPEYSLMRSFLKRNRTVPSFGQPDGPGRFSDVGTFRVAPQDENVRREIGSTELWASNLLNFNQANFRVWINTFGNVEVRPQINGTPYTRTQAEFVVGPGNIWFADCDHSSDFVNEEGYVVTTTGLLHQLTRYVQSNNIRGGLVPPLAESLRKAAMGENPGFTTKVPFAKVPPEYIGQTLNIVLLSRTRDKNFKDPEYQDIAVIDRKTKSLVPRIVDPILHPDRWS